MRKADVDALALGIVDDPPEPMSRRDFNRIARAAVTPEMIVEVVLILYLRAKEGNMGAVREFLDRMLGKSDDQELRDELKEIKEQLAAAGLDWAVAA